MIIDIALAMVDDADAIAMAHVAAWHETYPGLLPPSLLASKTVAGMAPLWRNSIVRGEAVFVARDGAGIVGLACAGPRRDPGLPFTADVRAIYLRRHAQGHGVGRALMAAMAADLLARDLPSCGLWVLDGNTRATRFYERLGGRAVTSNSESVADGTINHIAYGWDDVRAWLGPPRAADNGG